MFGGMSKTLLPRRRWRSVNKIHVGLFSLCLALVVGCAGNDQQAPDPQAAGSVTESSNGRITMGTTLSARTLDPADAYEIFPGILLNNLGDRLYTYEPGTTEC
jgi:peptide/nickel transport system substrate-binding protein